MPTEESLTELLPTPMKSSINKKLTESLDKLGGLSVVKQF